MKFLCAYNEFNRYGLFLRPPDAATKASVTLGDRRSMALRYFALCGGLGAALWCSTALLHG